MLTVLRKIRKTLINSGSTRRYALYAIGEIALVVIGILIAVQINNWNTERIERKEEQLYLKRMVQDLEQDLINMKGCLTNHENRLVFGAEILQIMKEPHYSKVVEWEGYVEAVEKFDDQLFVDNPSFAEQIFEVLKITMFHTTDNTFQELISTGKIDIINDQELKDQILNHYPMVRRRISFQDRIVFTVQSNYRNAMEKSGISYLSEASYEELVRDGLDQQYFTVNLENYLSLTQGFISSLNEMERKTGQLIEVIKSHIDE